MPRLHSRQDLLVEDIRERLCNGMLSLIPSRENARGKEHKEGAVCVVLTACF